VSPGDTARPQLCVGAVAIDGERLLLIRRATPPEAGRWSLPGGRVDRGETMAEAVVREVREETGLDVVCDHLIGWVERIGPEGHFVIFDFAVIIMGTQDEAAGTDASALAWTPLWQVTEIDLVAGLLDFLADHGIVETI
jgi:8-oxo-dGTP diphosphatase